MMTCNWLVLGFALSAGCTYVYFWQGAVCDRIEVRAFEQSSFRLAKLKAFDLFSALNREATRQDDLPGFAPTRLDRSYLYDFM